MFEIKFFGPCFLILIALGNCSNDVKVSSSKTSFCPESCACFSQMYNCNGRNLRIMINQTGDDIRSLDLSNNSISVTRVLEAPSLNYLNLGNNSLKTLRYDTFDNLDELTTLILSNNQLDRITDDIFEWNPLKLEVLMLDGNQIEFIQHFLLYDLEDLKQLYLQNNKITFIHPHAFTPLKKLTLVRLDNNHLHTLDSKWFKGLRANMFQEINLSANPWACDCDMKKQVSWLNKNKWFTKKLTGKLMCQVPTPMENKEIASILKTQEKLPCEKPIITGISTNSSIKEYKSVELRCVVAEGIYPVPSVMWKAPNGDRYNLQTADRFEGIEVFQTGSVVIHNVTVEKDNGIYTCVATNHAGSVQANTTLTVIKVAKRPHAASDPVVIHNIQKPVDHTEKPDTNCPVNCSCISQHVDCSSEPTANGFKKIDLTAIPKNAVSLNYDNNAITVVPRFISLKHVTELRLDKNQISKITSHAFDDLKALQTITLRSNQIATLPGRLFRNLKSLSILVLDDNLLTSIDDHTFSGLISLQWLYVRNNLINTISNKAFTSLPNLRFIHMENNKLSMLTEETIMTLTKPKNGETKIQKIFVDENQFLCDCNMNSLKLYLQYNKQWENLFGDGIKCTYPPSLFDTFLTDYEGKLNCSETYSSVGTVGGNAGGTPCHFPFEYNHIMYSKCILVKGAEFTDHVWCATTASYSKDAKWGVCLSNDYTVIQPETKNDSGTYSGLWFGGLALGIILCFIGFVLWKKYGHKFGGRSMTYSNLPGYDEAEEHTTLTSGTSGSEAFV